TIYQLRVSGVPIVHPYSTDTGDGRGRMTGTRHAAILALTMMLAVSSAGFAAEPDELMPGGIAMVRYGVIAKVVAKAATPFDLPDTNNWPVVVGATLSIFDTGSAMTDVYTLHAGGWRGLGAPIGSGGWKYTGTGTIADPCRVVLVRPTIVKA